MYWRAFEENGEVKVATIRYFDTQPRPLGSHWVSDGLRRHADRRILWHTFQGLPSSEQNEQKVDDETLPGSVTLLQPRIEILTRGPLIMPPATSTQAPLCAAPRTFAPSSEPLAQLDKKRAPPTAAASDPRLLPAMQKNKKARADAQPHLKAVPPFSLKDLVCAGQIPIGPDVIETRYQNRVQTAKMLSNGTIFYKGRAYDNPTAFRKAAMLEINPTLGKGTINGCPSGWKSVTLKGKGDGYLFKLRYAKA